MWFQKFTERARNKFCKTKCEHEWAKQFMLREYLSMSGFRVKVWRCSCIKCGKEEDRNYW